MIVAGAASILSARYGAAVPRYATEEEIREVMGETPIPRIPPPRPQESADVYLVRCVREDYALEKFDADELDRRLTFAVKGEVPLDQHDLPLYADPEMFTSPFESPPMDSVLS